MRTLLLVFLTVPLVELYLLFWVKEWIGFWSTVALTLVTGILGSALARREGLRALHAWRASLRSLQVPETGLVEGALILFGGALLITPGILTDITGFLLLVPVTRRPLAAWVRQRVTRYIEARTTIIETRGWSNGEPAVRRVAHFETRSSESPDSTTRSVVETTGESSPPNSTDSRP